MKQYKIRKEEEITTKTYYDCISHVCDICKKEIKQDYSEKTSDLDFTSIEKIATIKLSRFYEGYDYSVEKSIGFDICVKCFLDKIVPFFIDKGSQAWFLDDNNNADHKREMLATKKEILKEME